MSKKLNTQSTEVVELPADESTQVQPIVESAPTQADLNPIAAKIASLPDDKQLWIIAFQDMKSMFVSDKVDNDMFKAWTQTTGLFETSTNQSEVDRLASEIDKVKTALKSAGFAEDNPIVVSAVKGLTSELTKAQGQVKDNLPELAGYFGVKLAKTQGNRVYAATGQLAMHRPDLAELKNTDYLFSQNDKSAIVVHSQSISEADLTTLKISAGADTWIAFEYNGNLQYDRNRSGEDNARMIATIKNMPENYVKAHKVVSTSEKLSGLVGCVAATLNLSYNGNGWQSNSQLATKFDKVNRVVKA